MSKLRMLKWKKTMATSRNAGKDTSKCVISPQMRASVLAQSSTDNLRYLVPNSWNSAKLRKEMEAGCIQTTWAMKDFQITLESCLQCCRRSRKTIWSPSTARIRDTTAASSQNKISSTKHPEASWRYNEVEPKAKSFILLVTRSMRSCIISLQAMIWWRELRSSLPETNFMTLIIRLLRRNRIGWSELRSMTTEKDSKQVP